VEMIIRIKNFEGSAPQKLWK